MKSRILLLALASTGLASAASIVQTKTFSFVPSDTRTLTFHEFNTVGGTLILDSVTVLITYTKTGGSLTVDNDSGSTGTIGMTHTILAALDVGVFDMSKVGGGSLATSGTALKAISSISGVNIGVTSGDPTDQFNATLSTDYYAYNASEVTKTVTGSLSDKAQFEGGSTFDWIFSADQTSTITGLSGVNYALVNSSVAGNVTITYNYSSIPETSAAALGGLGILTLLRRRRR